MYNHHSLCIFIRLILGCILFGLFPVGVAAEPCGGNYVENEYLVKLKAPSGTRSLRKRELFNKLRVSKTLREYSSVNGLYLVRTSESQSNLRNALLSDPDIQYIHPNCIYRALDSTGVTVSGHVRIEGVSSQYPLTTVTANAGTNNLGFFSSPNDAYSVPVDTHPRVITTFDHFESDEGLIDIAGVSEEHFWWILNDGAGGYSSVSESLSLPMANFSSIAAGDVTGEGIDDLVVTDANWNEVLIYRYPLGELDSPEVGTAPNDVEIVRLGSLKTKDIVVANYGDRTVSVLKNQGLGNFSGLTPYDVSTSPYELSKGDVDGDGFQDIAFIGSDPYSFGVLFSKPNGFFNLEKSFVKTFPEIKKGEVFKPFDIEIADINEDGRGDLVIVGGDDKYVNKGQLLVLPNQNNKFRDIYVEGVGILSQDVTVVDYNGDSKLDYVVSNQLSENVWYFRNTEDGTSPKGISFEFDYKVNLPRGASPIGVLTFDPMALKGVKVKIGKYSAMTDGFGNFEIKNVLPGEYSVSAEIRGFTLSPVGETVISVGSTPVKNIDFSAVAPTPPIDDPLVDDYFSALWGLHNTGQENGTEDVDVDAPEAWQMGITGDGVVVGVVDSGMNFEHFDLRRNLWTNEGEIPGNGKDDEENGLVDDVHGADAFERDGDPSNSTVDEVHATHVAGTIAAVGDDDKGVVGVSPKSKIMALRFIGPKGGGSLGDALLVFDYALVMRNRGVNLRVLNNSWGGSGECPEPLIEMLSVLNDKGIVIVTAAGNEGINNDEEVQTPSDCNVENVISVAAVNRNGELASFSNFGVNSVDVAAPGVEILSTIPGPSYKLAEGTSMAAPHVSGVAALLLSQRPELSPADVRTMIMDSVKPLPSLVQKVIAPGIVSAKRVLNANAPNYDSDGDGVNDKQEQSDGTDSLDRGSFVEHLQSPAYALWNSFLSMTNILELVNTGDSQLQATILVYQIDGSVGPEVTVDLAPGSQQDIILNDLPGFASDSYGIVKIRYSGELGGRLFYYRNSETPGNFEFAFSLPVSNPVLGPTAVSFNTFQPSQDSLDADSPVSNWLSIVNLSDVAQGFLIEKFNQDGTLLSSKHVSVPALGRLDEDGGHVDPGPMNVGLNIITPDNSTAPYLAQLVRYGYNRVGGFDFAFPLIARAGNGRPVHVSLSTTAGAQNWLEIINTKNETVEVEASFYNSSGGLVADDKRTLGSRAQVHINANEIFAKDDIGYVSIKPSVRNAIIAQSMFYFRDSSSGGIRAMYGSSAREAMPRRVVGSYNLFLGMSNWLKVINVSSEPSQISINTNSQGGSLRTLDVQVPAHGSVDFGIHDASAFGTASNSYGSLVVAADKSRSAIVELLRVHPDSSSGGIDFAAPTQLR